MFAVLKTGGKQYKVQSGDVLRIEKLTASAGETVRFEEVLMIGGDSPQVGSPLLSGAAVTAEVVEQVKADKVISFVKRRRKHGSKRTRGHRQKLTEVRIMDILQDGTVLSSAPAAEEAPVADPAPAAPETTDAPVAEGDAVVTE